MQLRHLGCGEVPGLRPGLVLVAHHRSRQPEQGLLRGEHLNDAAAALDLAVGPFLDVVGPEPLPVVLGEVEVGQGVGLRLLQERRGPGAAGLQHLAGDVVHGPDGPGVLGPEDRRHDPGDPPGEAPAPRLAGAAPDQVDHAPLPRGALEDLRDGALETRVGVGGDQLDAVDAPGAQALQEAQPRVVGLGVDDVQAQHAAPAVLVAADGGDDGDGGHMRARPALDVGGVEPDVGHAQARQVAAEELLGIGVEAGRHGADLVLRQALDAHRGRHLGDLAGAGAGGVHLADRGDDRAVDPLVALYDVRGEEAAAPELGYPQGQRPHAGRQLPLAVAVPAVARGVAELVGLGAHDLVGEHLGHRPDELLKVDGAVGEPGQILRRGGRGGHALWYDFHCGRRLSLESDLSLSQILGDGHIRFTAASMRCGPYTNISDVIDP